MKETIEAVAMSIWSLGNYDLDTTPAVWKDDVFEFVKEEFREKAIDAIKAYKETGEYKALKQERDDYREALEFYAYPPKDDDAYDKWADDTGEIAKQALEKYTSAELPTVTRRGKGE